jgi:amino acid adenylation domain-containing protein
MAEFQVASIADWTNDLIGRRFERCVTAFPGKDAACDIERNTTYAELNAGANRLAHRLVQALGDEEVPVGLLLEHGSATLTGFFGAVKAGKISTPLDPSWPVARLAWMLDHSAAGRIISDRKNETLARELAGPSKEVVFLESLDSEPATNLPQDFSPDRLAYLLYTSGSTGTPKGIVHSHRTALHNIGNYTDGLRITAEDRLTWLHSSSFSSAWAEILAALLNGATICPWDVRTDGLVGLADWLDRQQVTILNWSPSPFRRLIETLPDSARLRTPRLLVLGSEPVTKRDWELYRDHLPDHCRLVNRLGATEVNNYRMHSLDQSREPDGAIIPAGYAVSGKEVRLVDEAGQSVGIGEIGQIVVCSHYCSPGYWRNPELTRQKFHPDPDHPGLRHYHTGDLGILRADGCLEFRGRADHQVKIAGQRIEIGEIENVLGRHEAIREAVVAARPRADGENRLVAYLVARHLDGNTPAVLTGALRGYLQKHLPGYMVPEDFVFLERLPTTETGKIDRAALPDPTEPEPDSAEPEFTGTSSNGPARIPLERRLVKIWRDVLKRRQIGHHDSFFDLGGNSLRALVLMARIDAEFGRRLPLTAILERPTIAEFAWLLEAPAVDSEGSAIMPIRADGAKPPLIVVHSITGSLLFWQRFLPYLSPDQPVFGLRPLESNGQVHAFPGIQALAERYADQLCALVSQETFRIAGYSFGGPLAYEVARQLHLRGRRVAVLAIINAHARRERRTWKERLGMIPAFAANIPWWLIDDVLQTRPGSLVKRQMNFFRGLLLRQFGEKGIARDLQRKLTHLPEPLREVQKSAIVAMRGYRCLPYPGTVTLLRTRSSPLFHVLPFDYGWGDLAGKVNVRVVTTCRHYRMVKEPHLRFVAQALQDVLDQAEQNL